MKTKIGFAIVSLLLVFFFSCKKTDTAKEAIDATELDFEVVRFDRDFATASPSDFPMLKEKYPDLFPEQYPDSIWKAKMVDSIQRELHEEVHGEFGDFKGQTAELESLFKHIVHYFPNYKVPKTITLTTDVAYNDRIILTDSLLLIGLDNYLGPNHHFYNGISQYIAFGLDKKYLVADVAAAFAKKVVPPPTERTFLAQMVYYGKELYVKDRLMPDASDAVKIGYSEEEYDWAEANEEQIWRYFVERELLYSTDHKLAPRFLDPAPFSKFRLERDNESPGRVGRYVGWQIVRAFMDKNDIGLRQLLNLSADDIFKKSNYKPKR